MKYEIERKLPGEFTFSKVGELNPQPGILLAIHNYQFDNTVVSPTPGTISYRIRQIIDTAAASFTDVYIDTANVVISAGCFATGTGNPQTTGTQVLVQPNPTRGTMVTLIVVTSYAIPSMTILIMDAKGSMLLQQKSTKGSGRETIELQTGNWPAGKYYVQVFDGVKTVGTAELIKLF
jgi:cysteine synthase